MLEQKLNELEQSDIYPFHMPGHKRAFLPFANPYAIDITEIEGFDNLHHATGILQEAQQKAADLYGAKKTYYLVNGSTCGLLAAISAAVPRGGKILVARKIISTFTASFCRFREHFFPKFAASFPQFSINH